MNLTHRISGLMADWLDRMIPVTPIQRSDREQQRLNRASRHIHLYYCRRCFSSIMVKRHCERLGLKVVEKDVLRVNAYRNELVKGGGVPRVPCLRIENEQNKDWLYSRDDILHYLNERF